MSTTTAESITKIENNEIVMQDNPSPETAQRNQLGNKSLGETCEEYWNKSTKINSTVLSKYNSEQISKPRMVNCTCCHRKVPGHRIHWYGNEIEDIPNWTPCEACGKFLSHYEEDNSAKFLGMCIECHKQQGGLQK
jgi:hypothetical protein